MLIGSKSYSKRPLPKTGPKQPPAESSETSSPDKVGPGYQQPEWSELFKGSRPKFSKTYNKYISSTQVPHSINAKEYYDAAADGKQAKEYYGDISTLSGQDKIDALAQLVSKSHKPVPEGYHFTVAKHLYNTVDRHQDGTVRDIYSKEPIEAFQYPDISLSELSQKELSSIAGAMSSAPEVVAAWLAFQNGNALLNCEHVVPQSYFNKREPMRSDLHHLFASDMKTNSKRGSSKYGKFQPKAGRGEVARATLYFMLRYPKIRTPYRAKDVEMLKKWSAEDPPGIHEKHRNHEIQEIQGNRNPFIDHPEWLDDFHPR